MPAKWQQWMPLNIEALWSSPSVQRMTGEAFKGYLSLLTAQWQSEDGALSNDLAHLSEASRLTEDEWERNAVTILRKFPSIDGDRLRNDVCYQEWLKAKAIFESRKAGASKTNTVSARSAHGQRTVSAPIAIRPADTVTGTVTVTETKPKAKTAAKAAPAVFTPPEWLPITPWLAFVEMRKKNRWPLTAAAMEQTALDLDKLRKAGHDPGAVLMQSVQRCWRGVFELKGNGNVPHQAGVYAAQMTEEQVEAARKHIEAKKARAAGQ